MDTHELDIPRVLKSLASCEPGSLLSGTIYAVAYPVKAATGPWWDYETFGGAVTDVRKFAGEREGARVFVRDAGTWRELETSGAPPALTDLKCTDCRYPVYAYDDGTGQIQYGHDQMDVNAGRACSSPALADQRGKPFYPSAGAQS
jgi:hypothetical protein